MDPGKNNRYMQRQVHIELALLASSVKGLTLTVLVLRKVKTFPLILKHSPVRKWLNVFTRDLNIKNSMLQVRARVTFYKRYSARLMKVPEIYKHLGSWRCDCSQHSGLLLFCFSLVTFSSAAQCFKFWRALPPYMWQFIDRLINQSVKLINDFIKQEVPL